MLEMKDLDPIMIASPDHLHTLHLEAVAKAGKNVYVEKPLAMEMEKLISATDAVKESGVVVQIGTQLRSLPGINGAREAFSRGEIGKLSRVEECRNSSRPYWYGYLRDVKKEDVDWKEFLNDRPWRPFNADMYSAWYGYYDFSHGPIPNLGAHLLILFTLLQVQDFLNHACASVELLHGMMSINLLHRIVFRQPGYIRRDFL
jgi:predicted dehydrogenase